MRYILVFLPLLLFGHQITIDFLTSKPRSIAKDYYIWRFLDQNISALEAQKSLEQCYRCNYKIFFRYAKKIDDPSIKEIAQCIRMKPDELVRKKEKCVAAGMTPYKFLQLAPNEKRIVLKKLQNFPVLYKTYSYLNAKHPAFVLMKEPKRYLELFFRVGKKYRKEFFNVWLPRRFLKKIAKMPNFHRFIRTTLTENLTKSELSLLKLSPKNLTSNEAFEIALIAIKYNKQELSIPFLFQSMKKAYYQSSKDKAAFWLYKITKNQLYLQNLLNSWDINIYTIYAHEKLHKPYTNYFVPKFDQKCKATINLHDPFTVENLSLKIQEANLSKLSKLYQCKKTAPLYAWIEEKRSHYKKHPYILPYEEYLQNQDIFTKALVYAIARQESRFLPASISTSYALGPLQFMPFLANATAKKLKMKNFDLDMMFQERVAVHFALDHLTYLKKVAQNPLIIAYSYNGGFGYTKRAIVPLFQKYDPWLAMELVGYNETKEYGKKVLANYYIYRKILGSPITLQSVLEKAALYSRMERK